MRNIFKKNDDIELNSPEKTKKPSFFSKLMLKIKNDTGEPGSQLSGKGNATFYDPNVAISACGQQHYDNELIGAMNKEQYGNFANSDESPVENR
nr:5052_t:CDS:2 [Entrophospora candida]